MSGSAAQWIGHTLRKGDNCIAGYTMQWDPLFQHGRPKSSWRRTVEKEDEPHEKSWEKLKRRCGRRDLPHQAVGESGVITDDG